ncbi:diguanylate cyclase [Methylobacterium radiodurans]|uniref:histidine kinase n=2 Tax=Methylobacterium radiodurans TaxID=2202828 RepID=A0A2U8VWS8_9HYPH|nr:diguanylate cyclase [Methylobacterium radiodurans]
MIFVTNAAGKAIYLSSEWTALTGQTLAEAVDYGWARVVHPMDRDFVRAIVGEAIRQQQPFSVRYRVQCLDGRSVWLLGGAVPSFGPPDRRFLGFLGSITQLPDALVTEGRAQGSVGSFEPAPDPSRSGLEAAADHLIMAHVLLGQGGDDHLLTALRTVLYQVGLKLAAGGSDAGQSTQIQ